jgi:hypothetical protein
VTWRTSARVKRRQNGHWCRDTTTGMGRSTNSWAWLAGLRVIAERLKQVLCSCLGGQSGSTAESTVGVGPRMSAILCWLLRLVLSFALVKSNVLSSWVAAS